MFGPVRPLNSIVRRQMPSIGVRHEDEFGEAISEYSNSLPDVVLDNAPPHSCCLRFIDPYGDAVFNQSQLPVLVEELINLSSLFPDSGISDLIDYLGTCSEAHTYVRFIGD